MENLYLYISLILALFSYLFTSHSRRKSSNQPPTIFPSLPIIGHLYLFKPPLYRTLAKLATKHGPILNLQFGSRNLLIISSPSASKECLTKNDIIFANRPHMLFGKIIGNNYTGLASSPYGDHWRNLRRIASTEILSIHRLNEFHDIRVDEGKRFVRKLVDSSVVNMRGAFYELTLNLMMRMISGKRYFGADIVAVEEEGKRFREILDETFLLAGVANVVDYLPFLKYFGVNGLEKRLVSLRKKRDDFFQVLIEQLREKKGTTDDNDNDNKKKKKKKTMIEVLLSLQESDPKYYNDEMIRTFVLVILSTGTDTSAGTMEWAMSLLLNHPQVLQKAQNEIDRVVGKDRLLDESDIVNLPYLRCIINETFRLYLQSRYYFLIPHSSSEDCVIGGYNIPRGTTLFINQWAIHHDPKLWTDPETFIPERFEGLEGTRDGYKLMPFGSGRRSCPGEGLAGRVIGLTLGSLIQCFNWERLNEKMVDMTEGPGVTMPKVEPLVAKCKPRAEMQAVLAQI